MQENFYMELEDKRMSIEKLKELLESGAITQEEFDEMAAKLEVVTDPEPAKDPEPTNDPEPSNDPVDITKTKAFQREIDKQMAKERKAKTELQRKVERLERKILTEEDLKKEEFERQQQEIEEQRKELTLEKNKMYAVKAMQKAEIKNNDEAILLMEKLVASCADEDEIDDMISLLKAWKDKEVTEEVDKRFKAGGYTPQKSEALNGGVNPFKKETFNFTEQIRITNENPELAAQLKAAAGVK